MEAGNQVGLQYLIPDNGGTKNTQCIHDVESSSVSLQALCMATTQSYHHPASLSAINRSAVITARGALR